MKREPLKGKLREIWRYDDNKPYILYPNDVASAVEWLKDEIQFDNSLMLSKEILNCIFDIINKAFEDVVKK